MIRKEVLIIKVMTKDNQNRSSVELALLQTELFCQQLKEDFANGKSIPREEIDLKTMKTILISSEL
jgi:hypothetical protein